MNALTIAAFEEMLHDSFMNSEDLVRSVQVEKDNRFMVATLSVFSGKPQLVVTVLNVESGLKEYDSTFSDCRLIKSILGHHAIPENIPV